MTISPKKLTSTTKTETDDEVSEVLVSARRFTTKQLKELMLRVQTQLAETAARDKITLRNQLTKLATEGGFDIQELFTTRYRNPNNPAQTWSGKGPPPKWIKDLIEEGHDKSEFEDSGLPIFPAVGKRYINPDNPAQSWSGKGPPPKWMAMKIKGGAKKEDFLAA